MQIPFIRLAWCALLVLGGGPVFSERVSAVETQAPDFTTEVRPILSHTCFKCHGPDDKSRKGKLRLDVREEAVKPAKSGERAIVPQHPEASELVKRILSADEDEVMPPPSSNKTLTAAQKDVLKRWIAAGAEYRPHWAFVAPVQAPLPMVKRTDWVLNPVDRFVLARLEAQSLAPSSPADRYTLVRRVSLDLIGLPPTPEEADAFVNDTAPDAYAKLVDRLLAQPQYGERWARKWLDLARYADTNGYEKDRQRSLWPWRDWVITALNADLPFDQFTVQQIAGDMLPDATTQTIIATGFHRNTMLNEEGGIDPLEFRFHSMADRVATTGKTWLGLTTGCAQCHTHKYDPITHREYFQFMAFLDNADEPQYLIPPTDLAQRRIDTDQKIAAIIADLPNRFVVEPLVRWSTPVGGALKTASGELGERQDDGSWRLLGPGAEADTVTLIIDQVPADVSLVRLEALPVATNPKGGPGRADSGNFVLNEFAIAIASGESPEQRKPVKLTKAIADFSQNDWDVKGAIDGNPKTGWGVDSGKDMAVMRNATVTLEKPLTLAVGARLVITLDQSYGSRHTLGRFRIQFGAVEKAGSSADQRREAIARGFATWLDRSAKASVHWRPLRPLSVVPLIAEKTSGPILTVLDDASILATGDQAKSDRYDLTFREGVRGTTAIRLEVIPDERLPNGGPGRVYYEGTRGDFGLTEFTGSVDGAPLSFSSAFQSHADGGNTAAKAVDGKLDTIWSLGGSGVGKYHTAVFRLAAPLSNAMELKLSLLCERYYSAALGRFRISVTSDPPPEGAIELPAASVDVLSMPEAKRTAEQRQQLMTQYLLVAPELASAHKEIEQLRASLRAGSTTLVMQERPAGQERVTFMRNRGEYLQPTERVEPGVLAVLNQLPKEAPRNRLGFARWLVSPENPLTARVTVNRQWAAFFGRGIVRTVDDFGFQGEMPSHPQLLDWLAVEFVKQGWSLKKLHRLIVLSATYQQSSRVSPELLSKDPGNQWLARGPRFRIEAEAIRDALLRAAGLLSTKIGGPSVFPPQPASVTTEGAYGSLDWRVSQGEDRYRRGLYTFMKRTAPYAMSATFDGPSGESCIAQREVSNSPLQALTMLNDTVVIEAAQALGRSVAARSGSVEERISWLFRRCLTRLPAADETVLLAKFLADQRARFAQKQPDPALLAGAGDGDPAERAAWIALARAVLNLDETITKD